LRKIVFLEQDLIFNFCVRSNPIRKRVFDLSLKFYKKPGKPGYIKPGRGNPATVQQKKKGRYVTASLVGNLARADIPRGNICGGGGTFWRKFRNVTI
jgi:hypothetical protein